MSTYNLTVVDTEINYTDLPANYPQLSTGDTYQPAAYTEATSSQIGFAILLPVDAAERVVVPGSVLYNSDNGGMIYCPLTIITGDSTTEQLAMIKFHVVPQAGAEHAPITIFVDEGSTQEGLQDRKLGKVVMDANILP
jgi:hypothetical protein